MTQYIIAFFGALVLSILFTLIIRRWALKKNIVDYPCLVRKIHKKPIPLLGGFAIFLSFLAVSAYYVFFSDLVIGKYINVRAIFGIWLGGAIIMIGGFLDDKKSLSPFKQLVWPIAAIIIAILAGIKINYITDPFGGIIDLSQFSLTAIILSFFWMLGMSYTTKILDGLDGLVSGITLIGAITIFIASMFIGPAILPEVGILSIIFVGAVLGFLLFNWCPASIFLGEGGSIYCGFMLGLLAIITDGKIAITLLVMGIPIMDLLLVIIKRIVKKESPFSHSDKKHLHFQLLDFGLSHRQAVIFLYILTMSLAALGLFFKSMGRFLVLSALLAGAIILSLFYIYFLKKQKNDL
ncbi:MAG: MraY family glycosyltransferase [Patescibacteria group bacterium]|nr:MraY family glycosyltransferase [Patescibacteria group bacterium]